MDLSIVSTLYKSASSVRQFHARVSEAARQITSDYEIILVNDGSPDDSLQIALSLQKTDPHLSVIDLSRNFGHHRAMMTGLAHAHGQRIFLLDSDLEEDPALLMAFATEFDRTGADVVFGVQRKRQDSLVDRLLSSAFYKLFNLLSRDPLPHHLVTMRLMSRRYVNALLRHRERELLIAGLWVITGFQQVALPIDKLDTGATTYTWRRKFAHLVDAVTSFSNRPLVLIFYLGLAISLLAMSAAVYMVLRRMFFGVLLEGWPSLIVSIWLLGGLTLLCLGVIGIYLAKVFSESKRRPYSIIREFHESTARSSRSDEDGTLAPTSYPSTVQDD